MNAVDREKEQRRLLRVAKARIAELEESAIRLRDNSIAEDGQQVWSRFRDGSIRTGWVRLCIEYAGDTSSCFDHWSPTEQQARDSEKDGE